MKLVSSVVFFKPFTQPHVKGKDYSFKNKWSKMMCLQQTFLLNLDLHATNVLESTSAGFHYHTNHPAHSMGHAPQMTWCKSPQFNLQQNSTIMLILNNFHKKNKFQIAKKLADKNHEIHSFKYAFGFNRRMVLLADLR